MLFLLLSWHAWAASSPNLVGFVYTRATAGQNGATKGFGFEGLAGVEVSVDGQTTTTDEKGYFQFTDVAPGSHTLRCTKAGYTPGQPLVKVAKDGMMAPQSVNLTPVGSTAQGEMTVGPGTVYVAFAGDKTKQPQLHNSLNWRQLMLSMMEDQTAHQPKSFPRPVDIMTCWDANFFLAWNPRSPAQHDYTVLEEDEPPTWICFSGPNELYAGFSSDTATHISVYGGRQGDSVQARLPFRGKIADMASDPRTVVAAIVGSPCQFAIIDTATRQVSRTLPCLDQPTAVTLNEGALYAAFQRGYVARIDLTTGKILARADVGNQPTGVAVGGPYLYTANSGSASVSVLDKTTLKEVKRIGVGRVPLKVAASPDGSRVFVTERGSSSVSVLDGKGLGVLTSTRVPASPIGLAVSRDGAEVYVACREGGSLATLDGHTGQLLQLTPAQPRSAPWGVAVRP